MNVNEILHRIKHQLPRTNYQPAAIRRLIRKIDGIDISERAIFSRAKKIAEAYHRIRQELRIHKVLHESRRLPAVSPQHNSTVSSKSDGSSHRLAPRGQHSFEKAFPNGPRRRLSTDEKYRIQPIHIPSGSALETLWMIIHRQTLEHRPDQHYASGRRSDTHREWNPRPVQYDPNSAIETLRRLQNKHSYEHHPERKTTPRHHPSARGERLSPKTKMSNVEAWRRSSALHYNPPSMATSSSSRDSYPRLSEAVGSYAHGQLQHAQSYSTSTRRGLEQPPTTQLTKRPRPNPGAYAFKHILDYFDDIEIYSDGNESIEGSEYCD